MTNLLEVIRGISREAAYVLERVDYRKDSDIRSLTQNDLQELLPGLTNFRVRKEVYETIHKRRPIDAVLNELKGFITDESLRDALSSNGALHDYLQILKTLKSEVVRVQEFLDAHIDLLEKFTQGQDEKPSKDRVLVPAVNHAPAASSTTSAHTSVTGTNHLEHNLYSHKPRASFTFPSTPAVPSNHVTQTTSRPQKQVTVTYGMVVSGNTLDRHLDVLEKLKGTVQSDDTVFLHLQETKPDQKSQVILVFCPVSSRVGTDVETALSYIYGNNPVILVMMHHSHTAQACPVVKSHHSVVLVVNVFFHETVPGLLKCRQNDEALTAIQTKLLWCITKTGNYFHQTQSRIQ